MGFFCFLCFVQFPVFHPGSVLHKQDLSTDICTAPNCPDYHWQEEEIDTWWHNPFDTTCWDLLDSVFLSFSRSFESLSYFFPHDVTLTSRLPLLPHHPILSLPSLPSCLIKLHKQDCFWSELGILVLFASFFEFTHIVGINYRIFHAIYWCPQI